jgi:hypothetical protein
MCGQSLRIAEHQYNKLRTAPNIRMGSNGIRWIGSHKFLTELLKQALDEHVRTHTSPGRAIWCGMNKPSKTLNTKISYPIATLSGMPAAKNMGG